MVAAVQVTSHHRLEVALAAAENFIADEYPHVAVKVLRKRDPKEPGRLRKYAMEDELYKIIQGYWRAQARHIRERLTFKAPERKALDIDAELLMAGFNGDSWIAKLKKLLIRAAQDGVLLFDELTTPDIDYTLVNTEAAEWASEHAGKLITQIDQTTLKGVRNAISTFVETPGMTIGDTMRMLPFTEQRALMVSVTEITDAYATAEQMAGEALAAEFPDVRVIKTWFTNNDDLVCVICGPLHNVTVLVKNAFHSIVGGLMKPPAHPNCRCWLSTRTDILAEDENE